MQAIILAAGMGRRLGELTGDNTKCMLKVNGVRLIDRALDCLSSIGLSRIILVVGYKGDNVKEYVGNEPFMLTYGDAVGDINVNELLEFHKNQLLPIVRFGIDPHHKPFYKRLLSFFQHFQIQYYFLKQQ